MHTGPLTEMGDVEAGVRHTFRQRKITEPKTVAEMTAITLARAMDNCKEPEKLSGLSRELRQWIEEVRNQPEPKADFLEDLQNRQ